MDHQGKSGRPFRSVVTAIMISIGIVIAGSLVAALLIHREVIAIESLGYIVMGILFFTGLVGGTIIVTGSKGNILVRGCIVSLSVFLVLLCFGALFCEGPLSGIVQTALLLMGACISAILVGTHRKDRVKPHRYLRRNG